MKTHALAIIITVLASTAAYAQSIGSSKPEHPSCESLRKRVEKIDAQARQKSTQKLTDQRREVTARMSELKCSFMSR
ncbi:hypothetical protein [Thauera sp. Sel9]|uniref:hypothetical protein n=1 Tax=Thauera sp. Sel9 TaxID=2974299 RepID=UPI0021E18F1C|nr:hypothetical protein [Thauera sp. Sel9]MCV2216870.1 hypothetical protein [Thauera sp. Sel9]